MTTNSSGFYRQLGFSDAAPQKLMVLRRWDPAKIANEKWLNPMKLTRCTTPTSPIGLRTILLSSKNQTKTKSARRHPDLTPHGNNPSANSCSPLPFNAYYICQQSAPRKPQKEGIPANHKAIIGCLRHQSSRIISHQSQFSKLKAWSFHRQHRPSKRTLDHKESGLNLTSTEIHHLTR